MGIRILYTTLRVLIGAILLISGCFFAIWVGIGIGTLNVYPDRRTPDTILTLVAFGFVSSLLLVCGHKVLKRNKARALVHGAGQLAEKVSDSL